MTQPTQYQIKCPTCSQSDRIILIEDLYFGLIEKDQTIVAKFSLKPNQIKSLLNEIKPPLLERLPIWLIIPPDVLIGIIVGVILLLVVISGIQDGLNIKYAFLVVFLLVYFLFRCYLNKQFTARKKEREKEINQAQKAADRWSSLFVCLHDMTVFSGHSNNYFPISEFQNKLLSDTI